MSMIAIVTFHIVENITKGTVDVSAKLDGVKLYHGTFDLCTQVLPQVNLTCPLMPKQYTISVKTKIPEIAPRVSYIIAFNNLHQ